VPIFTEWTPNTGTTHWDLLDDFPGTIGTLVTADDDTTYVAGATAGIEEWVSLPGLPAEVPSDADLILAHTGGRLKGNAVTPQVRLGFWDGATTFRGATYTLTTSYVTANTANTVVTDISSKTKADSVNFQHGAEVIDSLEARMTVIYTNIEWLEASGTPDPGLLMGAMLC
jgi:hypothetical protein